MEKKTVPYEQKPPNFENIGAPYEKKNSAHRWKKWPPLENWCTDMAGID